MKRHVVAQPAFNSAPFVVIAASAFHPILFTAFETVDIELAHIVPNPFKAFNQLAVCHAIHLPFIVYAHISGCRVPKTGQLPRRKPQELMV